MKDPSQMIQTLNMSYAATGFVWRVKEAVISWFNDWRCGSVIKTTYRWLISSSSPVDKMSWPFAWRRNHHRQWWLPLNADPFELALIEGARTKAIFTAFVVDPAYNVALGTSPAHWTTGRNIQATSRQQTKGSDGPARDLWRRPAASTPFHHQSIKTWQMA